MAPFRGWQAAVLLIASAGCGGNNFPPPGPPPPPPALNSKTGNALADKVLEAFGKKDAEAVRSLRKKIGADFAKELAAGGSPFDSDLGILLGPLTIADDTQEWDRAEKVLRDILSRSKNPAK